MADDLITGAVDPQKAQTRRTFIKGVINSAAFQNGRVPVEGTRAADVVR